MKFLLAFPTPHIVPWLIFWLVDLHSSSSVRMCMYMCVHTYTERSHISNEDLIGHYIFI